MKSKYNEQALLFGLIALFFWILYWVFRDHNIMQNLYVPAGIATAFQFYYIYKTFTK